MAGYALFEQAGRMLRLREMEGFGHGSARMVRHREQTARIAALQMQLIQEAASPAFRRSLVEDLREFLDRSEREAKIIQAEDDIIVKKRPSKATKAMTPMKDKKTMIVKTRSSMA